MASQSWGPTVVMASTSEHHAYTSQCKTLSLLSPLIYRLFHTLPNVPHYSSELCEYELEHILLALYPEHS